MRAPRALLPLACLAALSAAAFAQQPSRVKLPQDVTAVIVERSFLNETQDPPPMYRALVVTDAAEIRSLTRPVRLRRGEQWACGFDWQVWFVRAAGEPVPLHVKEGCRHLLYGGRDYVFEGPLAGQLRALFERLRTAPTHHRWRVEFETATAPSDALAALRKAGFLAFRQDRLAGSPWLVVRQKFAPGVKDDFERHEAMLKRIRVQGKLVEARTAGSTHTPEGSDFRDELFFPPQTTEAQMRAFAQAAGLEVVSAHLPETYWLEMYWEKPLDNESRIELMTRVPQVRAVDIVLQR